MIQLRINFENEDDAIVAAGHLTSDLRGGKLIGAYKVPTQFCDPTSHSTKDKGYTKGKNRGWWICGICGKPDKKPHNNDEDGTLGYNILDKVLNAHTGDKL